MGAWGRVNWEGQGAEETPARRPWRPPPPRGGSVRPAPPLRLAGPLRAPFRRARLPSSISAPAHC